MAADLTCASQELQDLTPLSCRCRESHRAVTAGEGVGREGKVVEHVADLDVVWGFEAKQPPHSRACAPLGAVPAD